ncbi:unnamed protein product [Closterium sp. NIES-53]
MACRTSVVADSVVVAVRATRVARPALRSACPLLARTLQHSPNAPLRGAVSGSGGSSGSGSGGGGSSGGLGGAVQRGEFGDEAERPRWAELLRCGVDIFALYYDAILAAMYALSVSVEGDCYQCVPPDPGIEAAALGASESALPGTAPSEALHSFTLMSSTSHCFFRDSTTLTPLPPPIPVRLADPSGGPVLVRSSTVLLCPAVPSGSSPLLVSPPIALDSPHHRIGHPSLPRLRGMHSCLLVSGLPRSLPPLLPSPAPPCHPWVEGRHHAAPHSSSFPPTTTPMQTLYMDVETSPTLRWTGKVGDASVLRVKGSRAFVRDTSADKLSARAIPASSLAFSLTRLAGNFTTPVRAVSSPLKTSRLTSQFPFTASSPTALPLFPPPPLILALGPTPLDPLPPQGLAPLGMPQVDPLLGTLPVKVAVDSGAARGAASGDSASWGAEPPSAEPGGAEPEGAEPGGAESEGAKSGGAEPGGVEPRGSERKGTEPEGVEPGGVEYEVAECEAAEAGGSAVGGSGAGGAEDVSLGGTGVTARAGGARTRGTGAAGAGGVGGAGAGDPGAGDPGTGAGGTEAGGAGAGGTGVGDSGAGDTGARGTGAGGAEDGDPGGGGTGARGAGAGGAGAGGTGARDHGAGGAGTGGAVAGHTGAGGTVQGRPFFDPPPPSSLLPPDSVLRQVPSLPGSTAITPSLLIPPPHHLLPYLQPDSPLPELTDSFTERREPESRPASLVRAVRTGRHFPCRRLLRPPFLPFLSDPEFDLARAASPTVRRRLATVVIDPSFESNVASALVAKLVGFAAACRLDYATSLVAESQSDCPLSVGGECALGTDVLEDRQEDFECLAAAVPHLVAMLLAPEGDPDAQDILTPRSYAEAITGPYSSESQTAMDAEMPSWKTTGTYLDAVPPSRANIVDGRWIFRVKRPPCSPPVFKAHYIARGFSQRLGVDFFQTFSPTPKMTTLRVLLHVAAQRDYELHSLDLSTTFLQGSLQEEI